MASGRDSARRVRLREIGDVSWLCSRVYVYVCVSVPHASLFSVAARLEETLMTAD